MKVRALILEGASTARLLQAARETQDMKILREDGIDKCRRGITTLEEISRVCF